MSMEAETLKFRKHQERIEQVQRLVDNDNGFDSAESTQLTIAFEMMDLDNSTSLDHGDTAVDRYIYLVSHPVPLIIYDYPCACAYV